MTVGRFRKQPVEVEAVRWTGANQGEVWELIEGTAAGFVGDDGELWIQTLMGSMQASAGDWIVKGVMGEVYPCEPDVFDATHEPVVGG